MRTQFDPTARLPVRIAAICLCALAAGGSVALFRSIPASYASVPDTGAPARHARAPTGSVNGEAQDPRAGAAAAREVPGRRSRAVCEGCGVVESTRNLRLFDGAGGQDVVAARIAAGGPGAAPRSAIAASVVARKRYQTTVRFRDGTTIAFNETTPRSWGEGSRVIVIAGATGADR